MKFLALTIELPPWENRDRVEVQEEFKATKRSQREDDGIQCFVLHLTWILYLKQGEGTCWKTHLFSAQTGMITCLSADKQVQKPHRLILHWLLLLFF